ncbi:MAG: hypothetical protein IIB45_05840 [Candidatus Marinimicrobia bacterium]|nr:hypothetical protein [Candidatus Neomarinimicrobiota bacterium]
MLPDFPRSEPPWIQWVNCIHKKRLLDQELSKLRPTVIFSLGESVFRELHIKFFEVHYHEIIKNYLFSFYLQGEKCFVAKLPHLSNLISVNRQMKKFRNGEFPYSYKPIFDYFKLNKDENEILLKKMEKILIKNYPKKVLNNAINDLVDFSVLAQRKALEKDGIMFQK